MSRFVPGQLVADKFRVLSVLGEGAMGTVYAVEHQTLRVNIALKVLSPQLARRPDQVERFLREGVAISRVRHRAVVQVFDAGKHEAQPWIAMELLEGQTLRTRMAHSPLSATEAAALMIELLGGLSVAHGQGIVHRDVKPTNIFLAQQPDGSVQPKLLDFGIALVMDVQERLTGAGMTMGTLSYMAPEQIHAARDVDARADLYAVGAILYEALSGRPPYRASSVTELIAAVATQAPPDLATAAPHQPKVMVEIVNRCLATERERRPQDARQLTSMLDAALRFADQPAGVPSTLRIPGVEQQVKSVDPMAQTSPRGHPGQPAHGSYPGAQQTPPQGGAWAQTPPPPQGGAWAQPSPSQGGWQGPSSSRTAALPSPAPGSYPGTPHPGTPHPGTPHPGTPQWQGGPSAPGSWPGSHPGSHAGSQPGYSQPGYSQPGYSQPGYSQPGYSQPGYSQPGYSDPAAFFPQEPPRSPLWHLAWILPVGLFLMAGTGFAVVQILDDDDDEEPSTTAAAGIAEPPPPVQPPPVVEPSAIMVPIDPSQPPPPPVQPVYPTLAPTPVPTPAPERPAPRPAAHACVGVWSGPLLQSDGQRGNGVVTIRGRSGSCGDFVERWASGSRCDYRLSGCDTEGNVVTASARTPSYQQCTPVRMRFTCDGGRMRFHEAAGRVTVTSLMSPRSRN